VTTESELATLFADFGRELEAMYVELGTPLEPGSGPLIIEAMYRELSGEQQGAGPTLGALAKAHQQAPGGMLDPAFAAAVQEQLALLHRQRDKS